MQQAGHRDPGTYNSHYAWQNPGTDGQAAILGDPERELVNKLLRALTVSRDQNLWQTLPAEKQHELEERDDLRALEDQLATVSLNGDKPDNREERKKLNARKRKIINAELQKFQKEQTSGASTSKPNDTSYHRARFARTAPLMETRRLLAEGLFRAASTRSPEGRKALELLLDLFTSESEVSSRPGLEPTDCGCSTTFGRCGKPTASSWKHVLSCHGKALKKKTGFVEFCFLCSRWYDDQKEWADDCERHLQDPEALVQCDPFHHGRHLAGPGLCPWCLGDDSLPVTSRMQQFSDRMKWQKHVEGHLAELSSQGAKAFVCPHPHPQAACNEDLKTMQKLEFHLQDVHRWIPRKSKRAANSNDSEQEDDDRCAAAGAKRCSPESDAPTKLLKVSRQSSVSSQRAAYFKQEREASDGWTVLSTADYESSTASSATSTAASPVLSPSWRFSFPTPTCCCTEFSIAEAPLEARLAF